MSLHNNQTKEEAVARIMLGKVGSLIGRPSEEYLDRLQYELHRWLQEIKEWPARHPDSITHE